MSLDTEKNIAQKRDAKKTVLAFDSFQKRNKHKNYYHFYFWVQVIFFKIQYNTASKYNNNTVDTSVHFFREYSKAKRADDKKTAKVPYQPFQNTTH